MERLAVEVLADGVLEAFAYISGRICAFIYSAWKSTQ
jgi:hypothetical protein